MLFRSVVDRGVGRRRENAFPAIPWSRYPLRSLLLEYSCFEHDEHISYGKSESVPPFGLAFSSVREMQNVLASANEDGFVRIYNTENRKNPVLKEWLAHENAVFDVAWMPGEPQLVTAAGDQMARLWDVKYGELLGSFKGHLCSIKSATFSPEEKAVFCTAARDGNIMVWDIRCSNKDGFYKPVKQISGGHNKALPLPPCKTRKRRGGARGMAPSVDSQQGVTVVLFRDQHTLISAGAVDGAIKIWDLRKNYTAHHHDPVALQTYSYPGSSARARLGYSGLVLDSSRSNIIANCTDDNIYMFNISGITTTPVAVFRGHKNSTFYVRSSISPDDQFLASGSSDGHIFIWKISDPDRLPVMLHGHKDEVTSVVWCPTDFAKIASCSDDQTVRIWRLDRETNENESLIGARNLIGWATANDHTGPSIPASPQTAAIAPNRAALPLSSSTTTPSHSLDVKVAAFRHRTPPSIKQWFSPSNRSPGQGSPPVRQVLIPSSQSSPSTTSPAERRAKRRLETGESSTSCCEGNEQCDCVSELYPEAKRCRALSSICPPTQESPAQTDCHTENNKPASSRQTGKENCSPRAVNWLSAMSQRLKKGHESPNSAKSPSGSKKQEGKTPSSPTTRSPQTMKKISMYFKKMPLD